MRLLQYNEDGELSLTKYFIDKIPRYAILSHTWGPDTEEVNFRDLMEGTGKDKAGYKKIRFCGEQATRNDLHFFWVDTCCIDKSNNTELSEAINSMFRWYRDEAKCYVYLSDIPRHAVDMNSQSTQLPWESAFRQSRWFTRGWTLQELIAPICVEFFSRDWEFLGDKISLERYICEISGIPAKALQGNALSDFSVAERMSWAVNRETTRKEDLAYSLLGIFDISMSLIYGEDAEKAFGRLQEKLYKRSWKHQLDELSAVSYTSSPIKRLKPLCIQSSYFPSSVPSSRNPSFLNPEPPFYSQYSVYSK
jgi:hypothetical protein